MKTEAGNLINATYKSGLYEKWKNKSKVEHQIDSIVADDDVDDRDNNRNRKQTFNANNNNDKRMKQQRDFAIDSVSGNRNSSQKRTPKQELKSKEQIFK